MAGRKRKLSVSANSQAWREIASEAARLTDNVGTKARLPLYLEVARRHGMEVHVVRRLVAAFRTSERLEKDNFPIARLLAELPFAAVEVLLRWHEHDAEGAVIAAQRYLAQDATVRQLVEQERVARDKKRVVLGSQPRDMDRRIQRQALQREAKLHLREIWPEAPEFEFFDVDRQQVLEAQGLSAELGFAGIDLLAKPHYGSQKPVAFEVIVVDDSINIGAIRQRVYQQVWRGLGLTTQGLRAGIVVVTDVDLDAIKRWIETLQCGEKLIWFQIRPSELV